MHLSPGKPLRASFYVYILLMENGLQFKFLDLGTCCAIDFFSPCKTRAC